MKRSIFAILIFFAAAPFSRSIELPSGFYEVEVATGISQPTSMAIAPDGRIFVCEQSGTVRIIKNGRLLEKPFLHVSTDTLSERGLVGIAIDPNFESNRYVYVYYTAVNPHIHNRISRFRANGDIASGESILYELPDSSNSVNHNGGGLQFGKDGRLYIGVGDHQRSGAAPNLDNPFGKMLRIKRNGTIPTDNPFYEETSGQNRAIWAKGLRNPFTFGFDRKTGRMLINDVGEQSWEEINLGEPGADYGWPISEGETSLPGIKSPLYSYPHDEGCSITGGAFYRPFSSQFPSEYEGDFFFADYCSGWIRILEGSGNSLQVREFASGIEAPVDLDVGIDGSLYCLSRGDETSEGSLIQISYDSQTKGPPSITSQPQDQTAFLNEEVTFRIKASGAQPIHYQWRKNNAPIPGANQETFIVGPVTLADDNSVFTCEVSNSFGRQVSTPAVLKVISDQAPVIDISVSSQEFAGGDTIKFSATAEDSEDKKISARKFKWNVVFHHDDHTHPFQKIPGVKSGSISIPRTGEKSANVWYRIHVSVSDADGAESTIHQDILPRTSTIILSTLPGGLELLLDGQPVIAPAEVEGVVGMERRLEAPRTQESGGKTFRFKGWIHGEPARHSFEFPATETEFVAVYEEVRNGM